MIFPKQLLLKVYKVTFYVLLSACLSFTVSVSAKTASSDNELEIPFTKFTLDNGLTVIVHEDHKTPIVAVSVWYHVGSKNENPDKTGFAHLFEHLMFNGSENYNDDYFKALKDVGATGINGSTTNDRTNYYQVVPVSAFERTLWLESDRMGHFLGTLTQEKLNEQREVVKNEKRQRENRPYGKIWNHIAMRTYPSDHPYSWPVIGSMDHLDAASLEDVKNWFSEYYHPGNATIVLAGDITPELAREEVELYFGDIPARKPASHISEWIAKRHDDRREQIYDEVPRNRLYIVWNTPGLSHQDANMLELGLSVLGGGKSSRLYQRLVQKEQLATSAYAYYMGREIAGQVWLVIDAKPGVSLEQIEEIANEELSLFLKKGPESKELEREKISQLSDFTRSIERVGGSGGKSSVLAYGQLYFGNPGNYKKSIKALEEADKKQARAAARRWLNEGRYTLYVSPPPKTTTSSLSASRDALPDLAPPVKFKTPTFQRAELENGLKLIVIERKSVPLVEMALQFDAGYATDPVNKIGNAHFSLSMLKQGSSSLSSLEITHREEQLGARIGVGNTLDTSFITLSSLQRNLSESVALFSDIILNPRFDSIEIERKRNLILATINNEKANPSQMALRSLPPLVYGELHPYGIPFTGTGNPESIEQIDQKDLLNFHQTWIRPDNATLIAVGNSSLEEIKRLARQYFGDWKNSAAPLAKKQLDGVSLPAESKIYLIDRPDSEQSIIIAGHLVPSSLDKDNTPMVLSNNIFGGNFTSRLNLNLREQKGWTYGAGSSLSSAVGQRLFFIYAPVQTDKSAEAMKEILSELKHFLNENPATKRELASNVKDSILSLPGNLETSSSLLDTVMELTRLNRPDNYLNEYNDRLNAITVEQLNRVARNVFRPNSLTWIIVGDKNKIEKEIMSLEIGEVLFLNEQEGTLLTEPQSSSAYSP